MLHFLVLEVPHPAFFVYRRPIIHLIGNGIMTICRNRTDSYTNEPYCDRTSDAFYDYLCFSSKMAVIKQRLGSHFQTYYVLLQPDLTRFV